MQLRDATGGVLADFVRERHENDDRVGLKPVAPLVDGLDIVTNVMTFTVFLQF